jgi:hypothetical protein
VTAALVSAADELANLRRALAGVAEQRQVDGPGAALLTDTLANLRRAHDALDALMQRARGS